MAKKKTTEMFKQEVKDLTGDEYTVLSEYEGKDIKLTMKHNCDRCDNHTYRVKPNVFLNGRRCPKCAELDKKEKAFLHDKKRPNIIIFYVSTNDSWLHNFI